MIRRVKATLVSLILFLFLPQTALSQTSYWVQIEAHATLRTAEEFAARYTERFGNVAGFRIGGGWYALAVGPFETPQDADAVRLTLLRERQIRSDAYITDQSIYGQQFWPAGVSMEDMPVLDADGAARGESAAVVIGAPGTEETEAAAEAVPEPADEPIVAPAAEAVSEPVVEPAPQATAEAESEAPAVAETELAALPEPEPEPEPEPVETIADARAFERTLDRDARADIQTALQWFGYYTMRIDAAFGPGTRRSIEGWQADNGHETWSVLTERQRDQLLGQYAAALARYDFRTVRDERAGIEIELPMGMVAFDRHESPFAHFEEINDSGFRVLLISQEGTRETLFGLYEIMQTLTVIPVEGRRERRRNGFLLTGQSDDARAHAEAGYANGQIKGWVLLWEPRADEDAEQVLATMQSSFRPVAGVLPDALGAGASAVGRRELIAGLEVRRPIRGRSGFFIDAVGSVVTAAEAVTGCSRVTIDEAYDARVVHLDEDIGIAVLSPQESLVPLAFAQFAAQPPQRGVPLRLSGFSFEDTLTRPILTQGELADLTGLEGEDWLRRLAMSAEPGDVGGPVFDNNGAVIGMLLPRMELPNRVLPEDLNFALSSGAIMSALEQARLRGALSRENASMPNETLTRVSADLTVLVSCWN